jgi:hypothetical protein
MGDKHAQFLEEVSQKANEKDIRFLMVVFAGGSMGMSGNPSDHDLANFLLTMAQRYPEMWEWIDRNRKQMDNPTYL